MTIVFGLLAALLAMLGLVYVFSRLKTERATQSVRIVLGMLAVIGGALLTLRGLAVVGVPLVMAGLGFLGVALGMRSPPGSGQGGGTPARPSSGRMSVTEARRVLGVSDTATDAEIRKAYLDMMKRVHPDTGGSDGLATRVQEARDVLLGPRR